jgi:tripartite ATP-independent transporter DctM subunit
LFLAGLIPGLLLGGFFMVVVAILARRRGFPRHGVLSMTSIWRSGKRAFLSFGMPAIIVGGLVLGMVTPTEAASLGVAYSILLSCVIYRTLNARELYRVFANAVQLTGELLLIVGLSFALGSSLSSAHVPEGLASLIQLIDVADGVYVKLLAIMILAIIAGMFLDPLIPVFVPVVLPTVIALQVDLIHFGVLMVLAVVIGQLTPPLAIALIITSRIANCDQMLIFKANMPFFLAILAFMLVLMAVPEISTWLPSVARN